MNRLRTRRTGLLLAVMMLVSLLSGCEMLDMLAGEDDGLPRRLNYNGSDYIDMVKFSDMEYVRPDGDAILQRMDDLIEALKTREDNLIDNRKTLRALDEIYADQYTMLTMDTLAKIHSDLDQTDKTWLKEVRYCDDLYPQLQQKHRELMHACAASEQSDAIEEYLGEGALSGYTGEYTYPEELVKLQRQESALTSAYYEAYADFVVTYNGEEYDGESFLTAAYRGDIDLQPGSAIVYYYQKINEVLAPIYVELVQTRQAIAAEEGYDSYIEYAYDINSRDYTPEQTADYVDAIRTELVPLYTALKQSGRYDKAMDTPDADPEDSLQMVSEAADAMGGYQQEAMEYMLAYELCDVERSSKKYDGSYEIYLEDYESPFVLVNSMEYLEDVLTIAHEFGHFTDDFENYGIGKSIDLNETLSQGMEYLTLSYLEDADAAEALTDYKFADVLQLYAEQGSYNAFEEAVYAEDPDTLTVERVNALSLETSREYGMTGGWSDEYYALSWVDISHFFEQPFYVISYCASDSAAFQLYEIEAKHSGDGVQMLNDFIDTAVEKDFLDACEACGFADPLSDETVKGIADTIRAHFAL